MGTEKTSPPAAVAPRVRHRRLLAMTAAVVLASLSLVFVPYFDCGDCNNPPKSPLYRCSTCHSTGTCTLAEKIRFLLQSR